MIDEVKGKKVRIGVAFEDAIAAKYFEGVLITSSSLGNQYFLILENNVMINTKYIQTIEII